MQKGSSLREGGSPEVLWQWVAERAKRLCGLLGETWESSRTHGLQAPCRRNLPRSGGAQSLYLYRYQNNFLGAEIIWLGTCVFKKPDSFVSQKITFWFTWWRGKLSTDVNHWLVPAILRSEGKTCSVPINNQWQNVKSPCTTFSSNMFHSCYPWNEDHATIAMRTYGVNVHVRLNVLLFGLREFSFLYVSCVGIDRSSKNASCWVWHTTLEMVFLISWIVLHRFPCVWY